MTLTCQMACAAICRPKPGYAAVRGPSADRLVVVIWPQRPIDVGEPDLIAAVDALGVDSQERSRRAEGRVSLHTRRDRVAEIVSLAKLEHPYEVPGISTRAITDGNPDYLAWITQETGPDQRPLEL